MIPQGLCHAGESHLFKFFNHGMYKYQNVLGLLLE